jgi:hypothetical protein
MAIESGRTFILRNPKNGEFAYYIWNQKDHEVLSTDAKNENKVRAGNASNSDEALAVALKDAGEDYEFA